MLKKLLITTFCLLPFTLVSQNVFERVAQSAAQNIAAESPGTGDEAFKFAVLNFTHENDFSDTIPTPIGTKLSKETESRLQIEFQKKRRIPHSVIISNEGAKKVMDGYFVGPEEDDAYNYWKKYLDGQTPDYYVTGRYSISKDYTVFTLKNIQIHSSAHDDNYTTLSCPDVSEKITDEDLILFTNLQTTDNISKAADYITLQIKHQSNIKNIKLNHFVYSPDGYPSEFSSLLSKNLIKKLTGIGKYNIQPPTHRTRGPFNRLDKSLHILNGSFVEENDKLRIDAFLQNAETKHIIASATCYLPLTVLRNLGVPYQAQNKETLDDVKEILDDKEEGQSKADNLELDLWTNIGDEHVIAEEGDILEIFVQTNRTCYLRFVYILQDGSSAVLADNEIIAAHEINKPKSMGRFQCIPPFGAETLIAYAQDEPFEELDTYMQGNYKFIRKGVRGLGRVEEDKKSKSEIRINLLTKAK